MTLLDQFAHKAALWHPEKNGSLTPAEVTYGSRQRVWWRCERGHEWQAMVYSVVADGCGCPYCAGKLPIPGETDLATTHPQAALLWHERNRKSPRQVSAGSRKKVWWRCERGHEWEAGISSVAMDGCGCPYCAGRKAWPGFNDLQTLKPRTASEWHPTLNGDLKPSQITLGSNKKVWWQCPDGHVWRAAVYSRTRKKGSGCPVCQGTVKEPKKIPLRRPQRTVRRDQNTVNPSTNIQF